MRYQDTKSGKSWDLTSAEERLEALRYLRRDAPLFVMLCPPFTLFSALQRLRKSAMDPVAWADTVRTVNFCCEVAELQMQGRRSLPLSIP